MMISAFQNKVIVMKNEMSRCNNAATAHFTLVFAQGVLRLTTISSNPPTDKNRGFQVAEGKIEYQKAKNPMTIFGRRVDGGDDPYP